MKCGWCVPAAMLLHSGARPGYQHWTVHLQAACPWGAGGEKPVHPGHAWLPELQEMLWAQASGRGDGCSEKSHFP